jgi:predicted O-linked N-acetylglucosamine transferase (SPINDLY family)
MATDLAAMEQARRHFNLALAAKARGQLAEAIANYRDSLKWAPDIAETHNNVGICLKEAGRSDEAATHYLEALRLRPDFADARNNLGNIFLESGQLDEATAAFREALRLRPNFPGALTNLGNAMVAQRYLAGAEDCYRQALDLDPHFVPAHVNLGNVLKELGNPSEAASCLGQALALHPTAAEVYSSLLGVLHYLPDYGRADLFLAHVRFGRRFGVEVLPHANDRSPDRMLRVGYVSPDFAGQHPVINLIEPILAHLDKSQFHVTCYAATPTTDSTTTRLRGLVDGWQSIAGLSADEAAQQIRADKIDILVDLAGHTANNRLLVFARKPAPVQVTHIGYPDTTGFAAIDYRITDTYADPPGQSEAYSVERLIRLPEIAACYQVGPSPDVGPLPARISGHLTFGCLNNFLKLNPKVVALWARILHSMPDSRLMLKTGLGPETNRILCRWFAEYGIDSERLDLIGKLPGTHQYLELYNRIDIGLDPFPYNGCVTTCDSFRMGVPVVSLAGSTCCSRQGVSLLSNLGMADWIAATEEEYVTIAARWAWDLDGLQAIRSGLRERLRLSAICDAPRFARNLEAAYRWMWQQWCAAHVN